MYVLVYTLMYFVYAGHCGWHWLLSHSILTVSRRIVMMSEVITPTKMSVQDIDIDTNVTRFPPLDFL